MNGMCKRCGKCCNFNIPVDDKDINRIRDFIGPEPALPRASLYRGSKDIYDFKCAFLAPDDMACTIYEARPWMCRIWDCNADLAGKMEESLLHIARSGSMPEPRNLGRIFFPDVYGVSAGDAVFAKIPTSPDDEETASGIAAAVSGDIVTIENESGMFTINKEFVVVAINLNETA